MGMLMSSIVHVDSSPSSVYLFVLIPGSVDLELYSLPKEIAINLFKELNVANAIDQ